MTDQSSDHSEEREPSAPPPIRRREFVVGGTAIGVTGCTTILSDESGTYEPEAILLTWQRDPTSTMTIDWHSEPEDEVAPALSYRASGEESWIDIEGETITFNPYDREIHRVELNDLESDTSFEFRFADEPIYSFRTLPMSLNREVRFAVGGDSDGDPAEHSDWSRVAAEAMNYDLDFFMIGGDFSYADGGAHPAALGLWHNWLDIVTEQLVGSENRVVPIVPAIGNHECRKLYYFEDENYENTDSWREGFAPFFYNFFAFPGQPGYDVLDIGEYLSIPLLDTDHTNPVAGEQTDWLEEALAARTDVNHVLPTYHVPGWPSTRSMSGRTETDVREHWVPLFEEYGVRLAFEHHDHAYNVTHPIREEEIDPDGVVYMGDGPLGHSRRGPPGDRWFISRSRSRYNANIITIDGDGLTAVSVDDTGDVIHELDHDGGDFSIQYYPFIQITPMDHVISSGDDVNIRTSVRNNTPVEITDLAVSLHGREVDFAFEPVGTAERERLLPESSLSVSWVGEAPEEEGEYELVAGVSFTAQGEVREDFRSHTVDIGW